SPAHDYNAHRGDFMPAIVARNSPVDSLAVCGLHKNDVRMAGPNGGCPFGVRRCFASPLSLLPSGAGAGKKRRQSGEAKHRRTPKGVPPQLSLTSLLTLGSSPSP